MHKHVIRYKNLPKASPAAKNHSSKIIDKQLREYEIILDSVPAMIFYKDKDNRMLRVNRCFSETMGKSKKELEGKTCEELWPKQADHYWNDDKEVMNSGCAKLGILEILETVKGIRWLETNKIPYRDEHGNVIGIIGFAIDVTEKKKAEESMEILNRQLVKSNRKLDRLALKDPQTGLYNHRYFKELIESEFYRAKRYAYPLSLIMLDIDYFKSINDAYGYEFGDLVLRQFAKKLRRLVRLHDYVIRFGDEEFVIVLPCSDMTGGMDLGRRLLDFTKIFNFGDTRNSVKLKLSISVVSYPEDSIFKVMDFIDLSEKILDRAKEYGGCRICSSIDIKKKGPLDEDISTLDIYHLKQRFVKLTKQANQNLIESIFAFAKTIDAKDRFTGEHGQKTVYYAVEAAKKLDLSQNEVLLIEQGAMLHDLGKVGISERILLKKGRLTKKEFEKIKEHPKIGVDIIRSIQSLHGLIPLILYHHERWDGKGYPHCLKGEEIPVGARIIALADVYQALISDRPYRKAFPRGKAIDIIRKNSGTQFDPYITNTFLKILQEVG